MKRPIPLALSWLASLLLLVLAAPLVPAQEPAAPLAQLDPQDGDCIVFLGDSITHQCLYTQYVEDFFYTRYPHLRLKFHNAGVGGAKAWDALERFERDVAAYKPKYVTVLLGMNDGRYQPFDDQIFETYERDMTRLIQRIREIGATPVLMTPTMFDARAARAGNRQRDPRSVQLYNSVLAYFGGWLRDVATESGHGFVDMYSPLNNLTLAARKTQPAFTMIRDAVHPDPPGQLVMAYAMLDDLGLRSPLSSIRVQIGAGGKPAARATGGDVSDVEFADDQLRFTWKAQALPFVVPDDARPGAELLKLGHRMSREALEVHGLADGQYELKIDDQVAGIFAATALARHIELQDNPATPQYQQALAVAKLNEQRNAGPVRSLRNEWRTFQQYSRLADQLRMTPDIENLQSMVAELKQKLEGLDDRIAEHERAARDMEDRIFETNQPQPRTYVLRKVAMGSVQGTISRQGQPLAGLRLTFTRDGWSAVATTDTAGKYTLRAPQGTCRVTIGTAPEALPGSLQVQVEAGTPNQFDFDLSE